MKIIVMHLSQLDPTDFLDESSTDSLGDLIHSGPHGLLDAEHAISPFQLLRTFIVSRGRKHGFSSQELPVLLDLLNGPVDLLGIDLSAADPSDSIGSILEAIDVEAVVLALSAIDPSGRRAFGLTTTQGLISIRLEEARGEDLVATILELAGFDATASDLGAACSLVPLLSETAGAIGDEQLVRERLRGLGYIA